jgi:DNA-binding MarR family transcriptional regulator
LAVQIMALGRLMREDLRRQLAPWQLSDQDLLILEACDAAPSPGLGQRELADRLQVSPAQMSGLVEQLRHRGLLEGQRPEEDRRRQLWRVAAEGQATLAAILDALTPWFQGIEQAVKPHEIGEFTRSLQRLTNHLARRAAATECPPPTACTPLRSPCETPSRLRGAA